MQTDASKSPLAMLKKTCETIGLADAPRRTTPVERRDGDKKSESPSDKKKDRSPRATPTTSKVGITSFSLVYLLSRKRIEIVSSRGVVEQ